MSIPRAAASAPRSASCTTGPIPRTPSVRGTWSPATSSPRSTASLRSCASPSGTCRSTARCSSAPARRSWPRSWKTRTPPKRSRSRQIRVSPPRAPRFPRASASKRRRSERPRRSSRAFARDLIGEELGDVLHDQFDADPVGIADEQGYAIAPLGRPLGDGDARASEGRHQFVDRLVRDLEAKVIHAGRIASPLWSIESRIGEQVHLLGADPDHSRCRTCCLVGATQQLEPEAIAVESEAQLHVAHLEADMIECPRTHTRAGHPLSVPLSRQSDTTSARSRPNAAICTTTNSGLAGWPSSTPIYGDMPTKWPAELRPSTSPHTVT